MPELKVLENGLPLIYTFKRQKIGHLVIHFNQGSSSDNVNYFGAVHLLEHMLFKGTKNRNFFELINGIEYLGAELNAYTTKENMVIHVSYPDDFFYEICTILSDIVYNSVFTENELKKEKQVICDEIKSYRDTPEEFIYDEWEKLMLEGNGLKHPILGSISSVKRTSLEVLKNTYKRVCKKYHISIVSCRKQKEVESIINKFFYRKINYSLNFEEIIAFEAKRKIKKKIVYDDVSQTHIILGCFGPHYTHKDQIATSLLSYFIGGGIMSSVLNMELREKRGISYTIETSLQSYNDNGLFFTYFTCDKSRKNMALKIISSIFDKYSKNGLSEKELTIIKTMYKSQFIMYMVHPLNEAMFYAKSFQYFKKLYKIDDVIAEIDKIKVEDINRVATQMLNFKNLSQIAIEKK